MSQIPKSCDIPLDCPYRGTALLNSPYYNKGSAFTLKEREEFSLNGLVPSRVHTLEQQLERAYTQYQAQETNINKNTFLLSLKAQNVVLFYALLSKHIKEMFPVIYTPTEGDAIKNYSKLFRRPEGCFLSVHDNQDQIKRALLEAGKQLEKVEYVVCSDGEEILGIGDQGVGGIGISLAKGVVGTLCAGLHPNRTLPVVLDCGTNNEELLKDNLYMGLREKRVRGEKYDKFVDMFVQTVKEVFPGSVLHFEDFGRANARRLLEKYTDQIPCFNDDIQGTGAVTIAAVVAAAKIAKLDLKDIKMVIVGAGTAGCGIAEQFVDILEEEGVDGEKARAQIYLVDKSGILTDSTELMPAQKPFAVKDKDFSDEEKTNLEKLITKVKPQVLIGVSTHPGAFSEGAVREMAKHNERPIILPLSNPTSLIEAKPEDIMKWTDKKALVATGSPFDPVDGIQIGECNNSTIFPPMTHSLVLTRAKKLGRKALVRAVTALAEMSPALKQKNDKLAILPDIEDVWTVSRRIAAACVEAIVEEGLNTVEVPKENVEEWVEKQMWKPVYRDLRPAEE